MSKSIRRAVIVGLLAGVGAGAMPATASADAATAALGAPITRATANGVITGTNSMRIVLECSAISVSPAASTKVVCSAGPARGQITLPGHVAEIADEGSGPLAPFTICATGTTHTILGGDISSSGCQSSIGGLTAAMVAA